MSPPDSRTGARRIFVATPGYEGALISELAPPGPGATLGLPAAAFTIEAAGLVVAPDAPGVLDQHLRDLQDPQHPQALPDPPDNHDTPPKSSPPLDPVFARQQLPRAAELIGSSVAALAEEAYRRVRDAVDEMTTGPFTIHTFVPTGAEPGLASRAELVSRQLLGRLQQRRRRFARLYQTPEAAALAFSEVKLLIQILLVERDRGWVSAEAPRALPRGGWDLSPWPAGIAPVAEDRKPPSRAYRKLEEAFLWMREEPAPGQWCVDLGGAPGGWTYTALRRGARVIAVDRAPLAPPVAGHRGLTMLEGNAFTYEPPAPRVPLDWLLSDVICEPARALTQLRRWLENRWCRRLVMTIKFKGHAGYGMLAEVRATLEAAGAARWRIKHLHHNKNEVTVMAVMFGGSRRPGRR
jgi:23S rRNA (cytidine2498-2'-O)-methyltransferase